MIKFIEFNVVASSRSTLRLTYKLAVLARAGFEPSDLFGGRADRARVFVRDHALSVAKKLGDGYDRVYAATELSIKPKYAIVQFDVSGPRKAVARFAIETRKRACAVPIEATVHGPARKTALAQVGRGMAKASYKRWWPSGGDTAPLGRFTPKEPVKAETMTVSIPD